MASHQAARRAVEAGYTNVSVMSAGITGWHEAGKPVDRSSGALRAGLGLHFERSPRRVILLLRLGIAFVFVAAGIGTSRTRNHTLRLSSSQCRPERSTGSQADSDRSW